METEGLAAPGGGSWAQFACGVVLSEPTGNPICLIWLGKFQIRFNSMKLVFLLLGSSDKVF